MKTLIILSLLQLGAAGNDAYWTNYNRGHESNPIARPFVGSSRGCVIYFSASAGLHIGGAFLLHKKHNRLANALLIEGIADHGIAGASSSSLWQTKQRNR